MGYLTKAFFLAGCAVALAGHAHNGVDHGGNSHAGPSPAVSSNTLPAMHGGVVHEVKGTHYELVAHSKGMSLYLARQGKPVDIKGVVAVATVISGKRKEDIRLLPVDGSRLEAKHGFSLPGNQTVLISVAAPGQPAVRMRFVL